MATKAELEEQLAQLTKRFESEAKARIEAEGEVATSAKVIEELKLDVAARDQQSKREGHREPAVPRAGSEERPSVYRDVEEFVAMCLEPFAEEEVGKLPRSGCNKCKDAPKWAPCDDHTWIRRGQCEFVGCAGNHESSTIHLDYVGHADITKRLIDIDPDWNWEPMGFAGDGTPAIQTGGTTASMWIRLTVNGRTKIGVGTCSRTKEDMVKELIGDALRNAAMRFGIALELWAKGDREWNTPEEPVADPDIAKPKASKEQIKSIGAALNRIKDDEVRNAVKIDLGAIYGKASEMNADQIDAALAHIRDMSKRLAEQAKERAKAPETVEEATDKVLDEFPGSEVVNGDGEQASSGDGEPAGGPAVEVPEEAPAAPEGNEGASGVTDLAQLRAIFMGLDADKSLTAKTALASAGFFPLKRIKPEQVDAAATVLADAVGA